MDKGAGAGIEKADLPALCTGPLAQDGVVGQALDDILQDLLYFLQEHLSLIHLAKTLASSRSVAWG